MDRPTCKSCPYWDSEWDEEIARGHIDPKLEPDSDTEVKECRRGPTGRSDLDRFLGAGRDKQASSLLVRGYGRRMVWLETAGGDWCGEHPDFPAYISSRRIAEGPAPLPPRAGG